MTSTSGATDTDERVPKNRVCCALPFLDACTVNSETVRKTGGESSSEVQVRVITPDGKLQAGATTLGVSREGVKVGEQAAASQPQGAPAAELSNFLKDAIAQQRHAEKPAAMAGVDSGTLRAAAARAANHAAASTAPLDARPAITPPVTAAPAPPPAAAAPTYQKPPRTPRAVNVAHLVGELLKEGQRLMSEGHSEAAELVYMEALKYSPVDHLLRSALVECLTVQSKLPQALENAKNVTANNPRWSRGFVLQAITLEKLGCNGEAIEAYEKAEWLAQVQDNNPVLAKECNSAAQSLKAKTAGAGAPAQ